MHLENPQQFDLPEEIHVDLEQGLKKNTEGKTYKYEKDGVYYGGDYLPEPPQEIDLDFPPAPPEEPAIVR